MNRLKQYIKEIILQESKKQNNKPPEDFVKGLSVEDEEGNEYKIEEPDGPGPTTIVSNQKGKTKMIPSNKLKDVKSNEKS